MDKTFTICGTPEYIAPETLLNKGSNKGVDFWGLGILIYEMMVGTDPFSDDYGDAMQTFENIINKKLKFPKGFDRDTASICKHLLAKN
jgi:serine/threonine protein kinase